MKRLIAFEWNVPMLIDVLETLKSRHDWETVYCVSYGQRERLAQYFPQAIYQDTFDARFGRPPAELTDLPIAPVDQPTAERLGFNFLLALRQMDRQEIMGGFAIHDRFIHLHRLAGYWSAVFDRLKPDILLFPTAPHVVYDYVAYAIAKLRGIRTVMFEYVTTEGMLIAIDGFEDGLPPLTAAYREALANPPAGLPPLSPRMEAYLARLRSSYDLAIPAVTRDLHARAAQMTAQLEARRRADDDVRQTRARELAEAEAARAAAIARMHAEHEAVTARLELRNAAAAKSVVGRLLRKIGLQPIPIEPEIAPTFGEVSGKEASTLEDPASSTPPPTDGHFGGVFYSAGEVPDDLARAADAHRFSNLEAIVSRYEELSVDPDLTIPFVYFPLHLQPERSTNPNGGIFDDQQLVARLISGALPAGWQIYIKEHRTQFAPQVAQERGRWTSFYEELCSIPGVSLVSLATPPFELIDKSRAVATITGTSSWEAIVRGVPTLVFGEAWYKGCPGSHSVRTLQDCRDALTRIEAGERPTEDATRLFLYAAETASFVGYLSADDEPYAAITEMDNIDRLAASIRNIALQ